MPPTFVNSENCYDQLDPGPSAQDIADLYEDNCGQVMVDKLPIIKGDNCKWLAEYTYIIKDMCNNELEPFRITYHGHR